MLTDPRKLQRLRALVNFPALVAYLRDELQWPVQEGEIVQEDLTYNYAPEELGLNQKQKVKVVRIRQIRNLVPDQPWGIFFVEFEAKRLPITVLRRILRDLIKQTADRPAWKLDDLLFICVQGESNDRSIAFAHFGPSQTGSQPELRTFSWDTHETHFYYIRNFNLNALTWPRNYRDHAQWRSIWRDAFKIGSVGGIGEVSLLARTMATHARDIRQSIIALYNVEAVRGPLHQLESLFQDRLGEDIDRDKLADVVAQTITYGLFAAAEQHPGELSLDRVLESIPATNPFLRDLLQFLIQGSQIDLAELGIGPLVEMLDAAAWEVITSNFMRRTHGGTEDPVIHFYERFLTEYDKEQRVQRGVFYTPDPVVNYIVRAVDSILKSDFGITDGLASNQKATNPKTGTEEHVVQILDPATGTGTFLAHVIDLVHSAKSAEGLKDDRWNQYVKEDLLPRLHGFELMMAPYTVAHMKLGLKLEQTGYEFDSDQRLNVYLTNALGRAESQTEQLGLEGVLSRESNAASEVKSTRPIMVVIGNPPYSGHSANETAQDFLKPYYEIDGRPLGERNSKWLQDDYVKFIRYGQRRIEQTGGGILAFITNHGYLDNPTFRGMRQSLMNTFDEIYIYDLHGNAKKKETALDGSKDENVFDIMQGVAVGIFVKSRSTELKRQSARVYHQHLYGLRETKYTILTQAKIHVNSVDAQITPSTPFYLFVPQDMAVREEYSPGWRITDVFPVNVLGFQTHRDHFAIDIDPRLLEERISELCNLTVTDNALREKYDLVDNRDWQLGTARKQIQRENNWRDSILPVDYRPFDTRYGLFNEIAMDYPRRELLQHVAGRTNISLGVGRQGQSVDPDNWQIVFCGTNPFDANMYRRGGITQFPIYTYGLNDDSKLLFSSNDRFARRPNISADFITDLSSRIRLNFITDGLGDLQATFGPEDIFHYIYAVFYCPSYRSRYAEQLKIDYPRLPLTTDKTLFVELCQLGADLAALHLLKDDYEAASWTRAGQLAPISSPHVEFVEGVDKTVVGIVGKTTYDENYQRVYIGGTKSSNKSYFEGIRPEEWTFSIGGYLVCQKWLKDRKDRTLSDDEIHHYTRIVASIRATIALMSQIDEVIDSHGGWPLTGSIPNAEDAGDASESEDDRVTNNSSKPARLPIYPNDYSDTPLFEGGEQQSDPGNSEPTSPLRQELTTDRLEEILSEESGLEAEIEREEDVSIQEIQPFDPSKISIETRSITVDLLLKRIRDNITDETAGIVLRPDFQRMGGIWTPEKQSRLIESMLIRIPLPAFYINEDDQHEDLWLVIDGLQRLTAMRNFMIDRKLKLQKLEFWKEYEGKYFDELPRPLQRRIEETQFTVYLVRRGTPHNVRYNIFKRINTGGVPLSGQEIRHAINLGPATDQIHDLAKSKEFIEATGGSVSPMRMADQELVLRFLAFYRLDYNTYTNRNDLDTLLNDTMREINENGRDEKLEKLFAKVMKVAQQIFGDRAFRKVGRYNDRRLPVNKALFEVWSVAIAELYPEERDLLIERREEVLKRMRELLLNDPEFDTAISYATGDARRVKYRFSKVEQLIEEVINA